MLVKPLAEELDDLEMLAIMLFCIPLGLILGLPSYFEPSPALNSIDAEYM